MNFIISTLILRFVSLIFIPIFFSVLRIFLCIVLRQFAAGVLGFRRIDLTSQLLGQVKYSRKSTFSMKQLANCFSSESKPIVSKLLLNWQGDTYNSRTTLPTRFLFDELLNCGFLIQIRVLMNAIKKDINPEENRFTRQRLIEGTDTLGILYLLRTVCCPVFHFQISHKYEKIHSLPINQYYLKKKKKIRSLSK